LFFRIYEVVSTHIIHASTSSIENDSVAQPINATCVLTYYNLLSRHLLMAKDNDSRSASHARLAGSIS